MWPSLGRPGGSRRPRGSGSGRPDPFFWRTSVLVLALAVLAACRQGGGTGAAAPAAMTRADALEPNATIERVVDGDTVDVSIRGRHERVRLIGIDTPETKDPDKPVQCYGPEASARTEALLPAGTAVRLERDAEARDDYGRLLAYVYRADDGVFINLDLARTGAADELAIRPNLAHAREIGAAVADAKRARRGRWGACRDP